MGGMRVRAWSVQPLWDHEVCSLEKVGEGPDDVGVMIGFSDVFVP